MVDKGQTILEEFVQRLVAVMLRDLFAQPLPESLDGVKVRAIAREGENLEAKLFGIGADLLGAMIGSAGCLLGADENDLTVVFVQPARELVEKVEGGVPIAFTFLPDEAGAIGEVVRAKAVEPCRKTWG